MKYLKSIVSFCAISTLTACGVTEEVAFVPLENDPRIGAQHKKVCYTEKLKSWDDVRNDSRAIVIQTQNDRQFKLRVVGDCDPQDTLFQAAFITRGLSNCLYIGDTVVTDTDFKGRGGKACKIMKINEWHPKAIEKAPSESNALSQAD